MWCIDKQELIFSIDGFKPFGWYLTLVQFALYGGFGLMESRMRGEHKRKLDFITLLIATW